MNTELGESLLRTVSTFVDRVKELLDAGAPVDYRRCDGATPLFLAAENGDLYTMRTLIEAGADVRTADEYSAAVLVLLAKEGLDALARQLLLHRGGLLDVDEPDSQGYSAMLLAVAKGNESVVRLLIACGADVNRPREPTFCPQYAQRDWPLLNCALLNGYGGIVALLLAAGADVNSLCANGSTPLHAALSRNDCDLAALLMTAGADSTQIGRAHV